MLNMLRDLWNFITKGSLLPPPLPIPIKESKWIFKTQKGNPFQDACIIYINDVKNGWVNYRFIELTYPKQRSKSLKLSDFYNMYTQYEPKG